MRKVGLILAVLAAGLLLAPASAEAKRRRRNIRQRKLMAKRAAESDALRLLAEQIRGLKIDAETTVRDFVAESDEIDTHVRGIVKFAKLSRPRFYEDGIVEVDAELKVEKVITELERIVKGYYKGSKFKGTVFTNIKQYVKTDVLTATGKASIEEEKKASSGGGRGSRNNPLPAKYGRNRGFWAKVPAKEKLKAERAAIADCYRRIAEQILGAQIDAQTYVRDFVTESDEIYNTVKGNIRLVKLSRPDYQEDGIVEVKGSVKLQQVLTLIDEIVNAKIKGDKVKMKKWREVKQRKITTVIEATGQGTTSWGQDEEDDEEDEEDVEETGGESFVDDDEIVVPKWAREKYVAVGKGAIGDNEELSEARRKLNAEEAARAHAFRQLVEHVKGLRIDSKTTVENFATQYSGISLDSSGLLMGAKMVGKPTWTKDGIVEVKMEIDLREVWKLIYAKRKFKKGAKK